MAWRCFTATAQWLWSKAWETIRVVATLLTCTCTQLYCILCRMEKNSLCKWCRVIGCKCFAHVPRICNMLQAAHCKILHFKCIELKRLWDYLEKLLIYCWPLNFTHLPSDWAPQLRLQHIFWKDFLTWDELNFQKNGKSPTSLKRTSSDCALLPWHFKHGERQHTKIFFCQDAEKQQISHSQI